MQCLLRCIRRILNDSCWNDQLNHLISSIWFSQIWILKKCANSIFYSAMFIISIHKYTKISIASTFFWGSFPLLKYSKLSPSINFFQRISLKNYDLAKFLHQRHLGLHDFPGNSFANLKSKNIKKKLKYEAFSKRHG